LGGIRDAATAGPTPEFVAIADEEFERLLDSLPDETLREIVLAKLSGFTNAEIAERQGRHVRSIERKLQLIRRHLSDAESSGPFVSDG
jgi:DNA-directed RNA polymerase specialized sigma24 family protein